MTNQSWAYICSSDGILLGCCGFHGDVLTVTKNVKTQMKVSCCHV